VGADLSPVSGAEPPDLLMASGGWVLRPQTPETYFPLIKKIVPVPLPATFLAELIHFKVFPSLSNPAQTFKYATSRGPQKN